MQVYHFKVSLFDHGISIHKLHRVLAISENCTFAQLHELIFEAFDRYDPHLYSFYLPKENTTAMRDIMDAPCITNPYSVNEDFMNDGDVPAKNAETTTIAQAHLKEKDIIYYWFDFGDDWWHRLRLERISQTDDDTSVLEIKKKVGKSPKQYCDDEGENWNDE